MTRHDELFENYEDALFMLLMAEVSEEEGKRYLEESERLNQDPSAEVPESLDRKCRGVIKRAFAKNKRREVARVFRKVLVKVAVVALVSMLLFTTAYALIPVVRITTLNLLIVVSDVATTLTFGVEAGSVISVVPDDMFGYSIPDVPDGFILANQGSDSRFAWMTFENDEGASIIFDIGGSATTVFSVDTEDADNIEHITIHGYEGMVIEKGARVHIVWGDTDRAVFVNVICVNVDRETAMDMANGMRPR